METQTEKRIKLLKKKWFLSEPVLFSAAQTHFLVQNENISVPFRTGKMRIEFSDSICNKLSSQFFEEAFKIEIYRILLLHPYSRKPLNFSDSILQIASDAAIYGFFKTEYKTQGIEYLIFQSSRFKNLKFPLGKKWKDSPEEKFFLKNLVIDENGKLKISDDLPLEKWYSKIRFLIEETSIFGENAGKSCNPSSVSLPSGDLTELWEENPEAQNKIKSQIYKAEIDEGWGESSSSAKRVIQESADFSFNYRKALSKFRQTIISSSRTLTRMKPSRRFGFSQMGSRYSRKANILIAVDVSGSICDESFQRFYRAIKNFFFLGIIENIDLIFFDVKLKNSKPVKFSKNFDFNQIEGRGGTSFLAPVNFFEENSSKYSGMIIFTDGEGECVKIGKKLNILWILESRASFLKSEKWIKSLPGSMVTFLP